jgi:hypothetical protein
MGQWVNGSINNTPWQRRQQAGTRRRGQTTTAWRGAMIFKQGPLFYSLLEKGAFF